MEIIATVLHWSLVALRPTAQRCSQMDDRGTEVEGVNRLCANPAPPLRRVEAACRVDTNAAAGALNVQAAPATVVS